ncbi:MAG: hypothetical protein JWN68_1256 [Nocardioides sp.]|jgi:hypothetical protein|uniref:hypothetical protein n=1 Tax=Nocardioides sp. TaxID=35761 RepID=UPI00260EAE80|nr:hypothetical protein [Nocardioides sp.]MCW2833303.1 hypothetical protein [Nocardioides sp.]
MTAAPTAPGRLGQPLSPAEAQTFLLDLDDWVRARRIELHELDEAALAAGRGDEIASDMMLSLALWQAVQQRYQLLNATFDGGRVGPVEAERLSTLVWGRLDGDLGAGLAVSLPEACRLSDALVGQVRTRLALVPGADASAARIKSLRAGLERVRDQVSLEPSTTRDEARGTLDRLCRRLDDITERAQRGADVGGLLPPLEQAASVFERDLIVGNAQRRAAREDLRTVQQLRSELTTRAAALEALAQRCVRSVDPAPRYAVPDVLSLGPVPNTPAAIETYRQQLERVARALSLAESAYAAALDERAQLVDLLDALRAKADAHGLAGRDDLATSETQAREVLAREPSPVPVARALVSTYQSWLTQLLKQQSAS